MMYCVYIHTTGQFIAVTSNRFAVLSQAQFLWLCQNECVELWGVHYVESCAAEQTWNVYVATVQCTNCLYKKRINE